MTYILIRSDEINVLVASTDTLLDDIKEVTKIYDSDTLTFHILKQDYIYTNIFKKDGYKFYNTSYIPRFIPSDNSVGWNHILSKKMQYGDSVLPSKSSYTYISDSI